MEASRVNYKKIKVGRVSGYPISIVKQGTFDHEAILLGCDDDPHISSLTILMVLVMSRYDGKWRDTMMLQHLHTATSVQLQELFGR